MTEENKPQEDNIVQLPKMRKAELSIPCILLAYSHLQPMAQSGPKQPPSARMNPVKKAEIFEIVSILDKLRDELEVVYNEGDFDLDTKIELDKFKQDERFKRFEGADLMSLLPQSMLEKLPVRVIKFSESEFQRVKEFYHDDKRAWEGAHSTLRLLTKLMQAFT